MNIVLIVNTNNRTTIVAMNNNKSTLGLFNNNKPLQLAHLLADVLHARVKPSASLSDK